MNKYKVLVIGAALLPSVLQSYAISLKMIEDLHRSTVYFDEPKNQIIYQRSQLNYSNYCSQMAIKRAQLETFVHAAAEQVIGQEPAKQLLHELLLLDVAGLKEPGKPIGSCLFLGPSGVGKTTLAKVVAQTYMNNAPCLIINMAECTYHSDIVKLIGQDEGWAGSQGGGLLTNFLIDHPDSLVILDEFDKACAEVQKLFLGILDAGFVYNGFKKKVDCTRAFFIATSNAHSDKIIKCVEAGMEHDEILERIEPLLARSISSELCGRFSKAIFFTLTEEEMEKIFYLEVEKIAKRLQLRHGMDLRVDDSVRQYLLGRNYNAQFGARPLTLAIKKELLAALAYALVYEECPRSQCLYIRFDDGNYVVSSGELED